MSKAPKHPSGINQAIVDKVFARRGRLHAFPTFNPITTALVVIDLDMLTVKRAEEEIRPLLPTINQLADVLRSHGGQVAWVTTPIEKATDNFRAVYGEELTAVYEAAAHNGSSLTLWHELIAKPTDIHATKKGSSAFFPGKATLHEQLQQRSINTLFIVGAVTNVCCEASARDAAELGYKVTLISDGLWGQSHGLAEASLATFFRNYGDVRPSSEILTLLKR